MKYARSVLLGYVDTALSNYKKSWDARFFQEKSLISDQSIQWHRNYGNLWKESCKKAIKKLDAGLVLTMSDFPSHKDRYNDIVLSLFRFDGGRNHTLVGEYVPPAELLDLKAMLEACVGEEIDTKQIGVKDIVTLVSVCNKYRR